MATYLCKKPKSSASTCNTEGSTASSSPTSSVNLAQQQQQQQQQQQPQNNNNNAPKYGTLVPNRIFVGGISGSTTETELAQLFSAYGNVKATKVISDRAGVSKGYGFVTFETEEEAKRLMRDSECIVLKERKLNIAPAIKKQPFSRTYEAASPPAVPANAIFYQNGVPYTFHNGVAYFPASAPQPTAPAPVAATGDPAGVYQTTYGPPPTAPAHSPATTAYPVIYPCTAHPTMYMTPQQFQYQPIPAAPTSQYIYTSTSSASAIAPGTGPPGAQGTPMIAAPTAGTPPALTALPGQPYYTTTHLNPADIYYGMAATGQPYPAMMTNEGIIYETPPHTEASSNQSAEDSCSNSSSSDNMGGDGGGGGGGGGGVGTVNRDKASSKQDDKAASNSGNIAVANRQDMETPVVSLLKLQQMSNEQEQNIVSSNFTKKYTSPPFNPGQNDFLASSSSMTAYFQQPPSMGHTAHANNSSKSNTVLPYMYHPHSLSHQTNPMYVSYMNQSSGSSPYTGQVPPMLQNHVMNGHSDSAMSSYPRSFPKRTAYNPRGYPSRRGGRGGGNNMVVNIPPFPAKLHMMNALPGIERQKRQYGGPSRGGFGGHRGHIIHNQGRFGSSNRMVRHNPRNTAAYLPGNLPSSAVPSCSTTSTTTTISTSAMSSVTTTATTAEVAKVPSKASSEDKSGNTSERQENSSPPPAPYSPMTCPVVLSNDSSVHSTCASPPQQVQFYHGAHQTTLYYQGSSNGTVVSQQLPVPSQPQPRRFLTTVTRKSGSNISGTGNGGGSDSGGKYAKNMVNGSLPSPGNPGRSQMLASVDEGSLGGAGDAPPLVPMTPPATPHCSSTVATNGLSQNQGQVLQETCHQIQALTL